ncbi:MAG: protein translocase subunit SecF [Negativicoccus succinicivorans]|uniref:protein translocase subunit SecF n=1 Tax=Negativicoccus succinicivorans TaxID=620903 RepID=UPI0028FDF686|nr:protein translocase subunit SecF [Negativicoccus succinicivorans]MDU2644183.1 protein translocase subunit SecF [Negativicoccus succinicivorans]MDU5288666.1 protein translocase subunit SecF [Negativicoccus succinicivorans]
MNWNWNLVSYRKIWFTFSTLLVIPCIIAIAVFGFNWGIDFTGGTIIDLNFAQNVTVAQVREAVTDDGLGASTIQLSGNVDSESGHDVMIRTHNLSAEETNAVVAHVQQKLGDVDVKRIESVGAVIGSEVTEHALINLLVAFAALIAYISYRFEYRIGISCIIAITHDILVVLGTFALFQLEIDASFLAAILTVIGYSMNESVVIFDRVRENLRTHRKTDSYETLANDSIKQSITRSFYTLTTVLFAVGSLYFFGGETTKNFALVMLVGFISGAYSSLCIATSLWVVWRNYDGKKHHSVRTKNA